MNISKQTLLWVTLRSTHYLCITLCCTKRTQKSPEINPVPGRQVCMQMTDGLSSDRLECLQSFYFSFPNKSHYLLSNRWPNSKNRDAMSNLTQQVVATLLLCNSLHLLNLIKSLLNSNQKAHARCQVPDRFWSQKSTDGKKEKVLSEPCSNIISFKRVKSLNKFSDSGEVGDGRFTMKHSRPFSLSAPINTAVWIYMTLPWHRYSPRTI